MPSPTCHFAWSCSRGCSHGRRLKPPESRPPSPLPRRPAPPSRLPPPTTPSSPASPPSRRAVLTSVESGGLRGLLQEAEGSGGSLRLPARPPGSACPRLRALPPLSGPPLPTPQSLSLPPRSRLPASEPELSPRSLNLPRLRSMPSAARPSWAGGGQGPDGRLAAASRRGREGAPGGGGRSLAARADNPGRVEGSAGKRWVGRLGMSPRCALLWGSLLMTSRTQLRSTCPKPGVGDAKPPDFGPWDAAALLQPVPGLPLPYGGPQVTPSHPHVQTLLVFSLDNPLFGPSQCAPPGLPGGIPPPGGTPPPPPCWRPPKPGDVAPAHWGLGPCSQLNWACSAA
ncbi:vegetative cell wall protein gp1-like [Pteropus medius]|uniref:vegetative cell wall protein gp1-like n=1 Tax=Pteropus vampyrus TaxID=132908 RepID=UPI00196B8982|nr:vegetative cell wall protein gp1-like [Pteropus giganteus]